MKKKLFLFPLAFMLAILLVLDVSSSAARKITPKNPLKLSWSIAWPPVICTNRVLAPWYVNEIDKRTGGRVKINIHHGGELLAAPQHYEGVVNGIADIGTSRFAFTLGRFPVAIGYEMPGISYNSAYVSNSVAWELYKKFKPKEMNDTHMLWIDSTGPGFLYTKKAIRTLADFEGMEIRADALVLEAIKALGGTPVSMPITEVYLALEKGVVKGTLDRLGGLKGFRHAEVTKYIQVVTFIYPSAVFFNTMNLKTWNSLPPDIQKVFDEIADETVIKSAQVFEDNEEIGLKYAIEDHHMEVVRISPEEESKWKERLKPVQEKWVSDLEAKGIPGREMLEEQFRLTEKYNKKYPYVRGPK
jgi:TRAP-type C4-dicarboxylate transport system substrate-binding protein